MVAPNSPESVPSQVQQQPVSGLVSCFVCQGMADRTTLIVMSTTGVKETLEVDRRMTLKELRGKIAGMTSIPQEEQVLHRCPLVPMVDDTKLVQDFLQATGSPTPGEFLRTILVGDKRRQDPISIFVVMLNRRVEVVADLPLSTRQPELYQLAVEQTDFRSHRIRLVAPQARGRQTFREDDTLGDVIQQDGTPVFMTIMMGGG